MVFLPQMVTTMGLIFTIGGTILLVKENSFGGFLLAFGCTLLGIVVEKFYDKIGGSK